MDFRTGKLSKEDHRALDRQLRAEAIQLLRRIDAIKPAADADGERRREGRLRGRRRRPPPREDLPSATMR